MPIQATGMKAFWNKQVFGGIFKNLLLAKAEAEEKKLIFQQEPSRINRDKMHRAYAKLNQQLSIEELVWKQKSCVKWLVEGERNTRFFHIRMQKNRVKNHILD